MSSEESTPNPIVAFVKDNKIIVIATAVVLVAVALFTALTGEDDKEPAAATPTISSSAGAADPNPVMPTPTTSAEPPATAPTEVEPEPEAPTETPAEVPIAEAAQEPETEPLESPVAEPEVNVQGEREIVGESNQSVIVGSWEPVAKEFSAAWANPDGGKDAWLKRLKTVTTPELLESFTFTDERSIFDEELTNVSVLQEEPSQAVFSATFKESGTLIDCVVVVQPDGSWLVKSVAEHVE